MNIEKLLNSHGISGKGISIKDKTDLINTIGNPASIDLPISDAILKLIDAKSTLVTNLKSKGLNINNTEGLKSIADKIPQMSSKRFASGTTTSSSTGISVPSGVAYLINVTGISFKPNLIIIECENHYGIMRKVYRNIPSIDMSLYIKDISFDMGGWTVTENGFSTGIIEGNMNAKWYAYE